MRKHLVVAVALLAGIVAVAWAGQAGPVASHERVDNQKTASDSPADENVVAEHDVDSSAYRADCLTCHADVLTQETQDPRLLSFHQAMMPFTPGYNPAHGPTDDVCVQCHRFVEIRQDSAGALRRQVDPEMCALCHGPSGPGPVYYKR